MTRNLLLVLHIAGVAAWLGANFVQLVLTPRFGREPADVAAAWTRETVWLGERFYNVAGLDIAITGVLLVLQGGWSWSSAFIWVGVAVIVISGALGALAFVPLGNRRVEALETGNHDAVATTQGRLLALTVLDSALVLTAVLAMVDKWLV